MAYSIKKLAEDWKVKRKLCNWRQMYQNTDAVRDIPKFERRGEKSHN